MLACVSAGGVGRLRAMMPSLPVSDLSQLIRSMEPLLNEGVYVFACVPEVKKDADTTPSFFSVAESPGVIAVFREREGWSVIAEESVARRLGLRVVFRAAWITLTVHSDLAAVGLTAAFSRVLAEAGISCNVVAGVRHDHIFVPVERAADAMAALRRLQTGKS